MNEINDIDFERDLEQDQLGKVDDSELHGIADVCQSLVDL